MSMLTITRYKNYIADIDKLLSEKKMSDEEVKALEATLNIPFEEFFVFQSRQADAFASGIIDESTSMRIYRSLGGESYKGEANGGWAEGVKLAEKYMITKLMAELMAKRLRQMAR